LYIKIDRLDYCPTEIKAERSNQVKIQADDCNQVYSEQ